MRKGKPTRIDRLITCIERLTNTIAANTRAVEAMTREMQTPMVQVEEGEEAEQDDEDKGILLLDGTRLQ